MVYVCMYVFMNLSLLLSLFIYRMREREREIKRELISVNVYMYKKCKSSKIHPTEEKKIYTSKKNNNKIKKTSIFGLTST